MLFCTILKKKKKHLVNSHHMTKASYHFISEKFWKSALCDVTEGTDYLPRLRTLEGSRKLKF